MPRGLVELDEEAFNAVLRQAPMRRVLTRIGNEMVDTVRMMAPRSGDNVPRHIHPWSRRAGMGYEHYEDDIEVVVLVRHRVQTLYVIANRHAIYLEFGWRDMDGRWHPPRLYLRRALRMVSW